MMDVSIQDHDAVTTKEEETCSPAADSHVEAVRYPLHDKNYKKYSILKSFQNRKLKNDLHNIFFQN